MMDKVVFGTMLFLTLVLTAFNAWMLWELWDFINLLRGYPY